MVTFVKSEKELRKQREGKQVKTQTIEGIKKMAVLHKIKELENFLL